MLERNLKKNSKKKNSKIIITFFIFLALFYSYNASSFAIEENQTQITQEKKHFNFFKKNKNNTQNETPKENKKQKKLSLFNKKSRVEEIKLPPVIEGKPKIPFNQLKVMALDDCVDYAIEHNPNLAV